MNDNERIMRLNSNLSKKRKDGQLFKKINKLDVNIVDIKDEYIGDELIGNVLKERDEYRTKFNHMKNDLIFFLTKHNKPINVLDTELLAKTLNDLCVIHSISDIPKHYDNGFYDIKHGKFELDKDKQLKHFKNIREKGVVDYD